MKTYLIDLDKFRSFQSVDLANLPKGDPLWGLSVSSRQSGLLEAEDTASLDWKMKYAEFLYDTGSYRELIEHVSGILVAVGQINDSRILARAKALQCLAEISLGKGRAARGHLEEFAEGLGESADPYVEGTQNLVHGCYLSSGATGEPNAHARAAGYFRRAAGLFETCGDTDLTILCRAERSASLASMGKYLEAIKEIEMGMDLATRMGGSRYTGRLLSFWANAAVDQGYRKGLESVLLRSIQWCEFVGDFWGRIVASYAMARLLAFSMPSGDIAAASEPERYFLDTIREAEVHGTIGFAGQVTASLAWMYEKSGDLERRRRLIEREDRGGGGRQEHFEVMLQNTDEVVNAISVRIPARLQDGVENHPDAFFIFDMLGDPEGGCVDFLNEYRNKVGASMLGVVRADVFLYSEAEDCQQLSGLAEPLIDAIERHLSFQDRVRVESGEDNLWYARQIIPSGDSAILIVRDVTAETQIEVALRRAAESAERSDRSKSEFLANMSHEIRTPISGVLGLARMLADTRLDSIQQSYVDDIVGSGDILINVIGNILDLSKMESLNMPLDVRPAVIEDIVTATVRLFQGQAAEKGIRLTSKIEPSTPKVILADGPRIRQIVANLVGNAVKFTQRGSVSITVGCEGDTMSIEVADTGTGIPEDRLDAIFDRFQQASSDSRIFGGTGLGLTISKGIAELMGGTITVTSRLGEGSRFVVRLPISEATDAVLPNRDAIRPRLDGVRVLLVDDDRINKMVSEFALTKLGCVVTLAGNGAEALELCQRAAFDIVLMDIRMPVLDGLEATRELRRREEPVGTRTPVVALTAGALVEERTECFDAGMDDYITKPFSGDLLQQVLAKWVLGGISE